MGSGLATRYSEWLTTHSRLVVLTLLLLTAVVAAGAVVNETDDAGIGQFDVDSPETAASEEIKTTYGADEERVLSQLVVRDRGGDVLTRESLLAGLELQQQVRGNENIDATLDEPGFAGFENMVGSLAAVEDGNEPTPENQYSALESRSAGEVDELVETALDPATETPGELRPLELLPTSYEEGTTTAEARLTLIFQADDSGPDQAPQAAYDAQVEIATLADGQFDDSFVFGQGITNDASNRAVGDSFAIITPVALLLVIFVLGITYRDVLDVLIAFVGIAAVMAWLAGLMGWLQIPMNQILIAVPFLLIGLSIDYALHVVMRYREARSGELDSASGGDPTVDEKSSSDKNPIADEKPTPEENLTAEKQSIGVRAGMGLGLAGVILALAAATFSTGVGFLSNIVSPLPAIRDFAVLSAGGILATFIVFGALVPALKVEVDSVVEGRFGWRRDKPAFGVGAGLANGLLQRIAAGVRRFPFLIIGVALLLVAGGLVGATTIETEFNEADFLPEDAPAWTGYLPGPLQPDTYTIKDDLAYLSENYQLRGQENRAEILIRGEVTDATLLTTLDTTSQNVDQDSSIAFRASGVAAIEGPHTMLREVAGENETVAAAIDDRDTSNNGLPDRDVETVYDLAFEADSDAAGTVLYRSDGEYETSRLLVGVRGDASAQRVATDTRGVAGEIEAGAPVTAIATGGPVTTAVIQDALLETLIQAFAVTLVVILIFLTVLYWVRYRAPTIGIVAIAPVVGALAWLLGAMALLDIPFNSETAVITSLAIGLGVDYSIHATERFVDERDEHQSLDTAMERTITGTGGALLASGATTAAGFGVLSLALAPPLQRFGIVTGVSIVFALIACLTVLPCLLVLRERIRQRILN